MNTTAVDRHIAAIQSGRVSKTNIAGIRRAFNAFGRISNGWSVSRMQADVTSDQIDALDAALSEHHPTALGDLHDGGLKVLRNKRYAKRWTDQQRRIIDADHVRFDLIRFDEIDGRGNHHVPVYRVIGFDGSFVFRNIPWQSGGNGPEVLDA